MYALADPRDLRAIRYVGQTTAPRRRLLQHLNTARLWLPDEVPWWIRKPELRPLYTWLRELYADESRLPAMIVVDWVPAERARLAERERILEGLRIGHALLNVEGERGRSQLPLL